MSDSNLHTCEKAAPGWGKLDIPCSECERDGIMRRFSDGLPYKTIDGQIHPPKPTEVVDSMDDYPNPRERKQEPKELSAERLALIDRCKSNTAGYFVPELLEHITVLAQQRDAAREDVHELCEVLDHIQHALDESSPVASGWIWLREYLRLKGVYEGNLQENAVIVEACAVALLAKSKRDENDQHCLCEFASPGFDGTNHDPRCWKVRVP